MQTSPKLARAMRHPIFSLTGIALSLFAWVFGAFLLGMGNAYFGVDGEFAAQRVSEQSTQHDHHQLVGYGLNDAGNQPRTGSLGHSAHATPNEPLPAHCLFCLDGLAATSDSYPAVHALLTELSSLAKLARYGQAFVKDYLPRPATRAPPVRSPAH